MAARTYGALAIGYYSKRYSAAIRRYAAQQPSSPSA